jgi:hypothetical protein
MTGRFKRLVRRAMHYFLENRYEHYPVDIILGNGILLILAFDYLRYPSAPKKAIDGPHAGSLSGATRLLEELLQGRAAIE